jgi:ketosteroid isomerase-like protein
VQAAPACRRIDTAKPSRRRSVARRPGGRRPLDADVRNMGPATREVNTEGAATIRRLLSAFNRGDFAALNELDREVELQDEPRIPGAGWNYGHRGAIDWAVKLWQSFDRLIVSVVEPVEVSGSVVARWHARANGKRSGIEVDMHGYCAFTLRRGKIRRITFHETRDEAMEAIGRIGTAARRNGAEPRVAQDLAAWRPFSESEAPGRGA